MLKVFGVMLECDTNNRYAQIVLAKTAEEAIEKRRSKLRADEEERVARFKSEHPDQEPQARDGIYELFKVETLHYVNIE